MLITIERAKRHLRIDDNNLDVEVTDQIESASAIVIDYLKINQTVVDEWELNGTPPLVAAAILLVLGELFKERESGSDPLSKGVKNLLHRLRDPALK